MSRKDVAREIQRRVDLPGDELPTSIESFIETHAGPSRSYRYDSTWVPWESGVFLMIIIDGKTLRTLRYAAQYITKPPKANTMPTKWQAAMEALLLGRRTRRTAMLARNGNAPRGSDNGDHSRGDWGA